MRGESSHLARHRRRSQPERLTFRLRCGHMISFGTGDVRRHTSACRGSIYMDRAMPEPIARALVGGVVLSLSPGRFVLVHSVWLNVGRSWGMMAAVVLQPASQKRPDSELRTANSVRALSFGSALLSSARSLFSSYGFSLLNHQRLGRGFKTASLPRRLCIFRSGYSRSSTSRSVVSR